MNEEIELEINSAYDALLDSKIAIDNERYNNSINRSYYAVFHATKAMLLKKGIKTKNHGGTLQLFSKEYIKTGIFDKGTSKILYSLFEDRQDADYNIHSNFNEKNAEYNLEKAEEFLDECSKFL